MRGRGESGGGGRERDVGCLSVLACGICDCNSEPFASIHFREGLASGRLCFPNTAGETHVRTQTHMPRKGVCAYSTIYIQTKAHFMEELP